MNQILYTNINNKSHPSSNTKTNYIYRSLFVIAILLLTILFIYLFIKVYRKNINEQIAHKLNSSYSVSTLYSNNTSTHASIEESTPFVIGIIKIDKINVNYSILSVCNNNLLDISVCRFAGPMPNEVGNLCIAGHNYVDYKFFSRLNELEKKDKIKIYDLNGTFKEYSVFDIYETTPDDISCTFQDTNGLRIITLITCNNVNGKRLVIKAQEIP